LVDLELPEPQRATETEAKSTLKRSRAEYEAAECERLVVALNDSGWNVRKTSRTLGIPSNTLYRKMHKYGITRPSR
jgi:transcriptional regulator of acetoin/glycerol metabolism